MITKIKFKHKIARAMIEHLTYDVKDLTLVTDEDEEIPLSEVLETIMKLHKEKQENKKLEPSGAV